ncbi:MAG: hypothetical protein CMF45_01345 [Legionellales bacterium]|nr:hypothetical protein [Legionellales bacterium]
MIKNVLGTILESCCDELNTGYFRNGKCETCDNDLGMHTVCAEMSGVFLEFSKNNGNDLSTPVDAYNFPGLTAGDRWCICLPRWIAALEEGLAPKILLRSTNYSVLEHVPLEVLEKYAIRDD